MHLMHNMPIGPVGVWNRHAAPLACYPRGHLQRLRSHVRQHVHLHLHRLRCRRAFHPARQAAGRHRHPLQCLARIPGRHLCRLGPALGAQCVAAGHDLALQHRRLGARCTGEGADPRPACRGCRVPACAGLQQPGGRVGHHAPPRGQAHHCQGLSQARPVRRRPLVRAGARVQGWRARQGDQGRGLCGRRGPGHAPVHARPARGHGKVRARHVRCPCGPGPLPALGHRGGQPDRPAWRQQARSHAGRAAGAARRRPGGTVALRGRGAGRVRTPQTAQVAARPGRRGRECQVVRGGVCAGGRQPVVPQRRVLPVQRGSPGGAGGPGRLLGATPADERRGPSGPHALWLPLCRNPGAAGGCGRRPRHLGLA